MSGLSEALRGRVLAKLGFEAPPPPDPAGLAALYARWCRRVPFDNVRKLVQLRGGESGRLPGDEPEDFLEGWLAHGCGGTCWAGAGAWCALLESLGFDAHRALATMLVAPDLPPNHGTVSVALAGETYLVDASMGYGTPLRLDAARETAVVHPALGVTARPVGPRWIVRLRVPHRPDGLDCRIERFGASAAEFSERHEATRGWSPFNYSLYLRVLRGEGSLAAAYGQRIEVDAAGARRTSALDREGRLRLLAEAGIAPAFAARLPDDLPLPPPPPRPSSR